MYVIYRHEKSCNPLTTVYVTSASNVPYLAAQSKQCFVLFWSLKGDLHKQKEGTSQTKLYKMSRKISMWCLPKENAVLQHWQPTWQVQNFKHFNTITRVYKCVFLGIVSCLFMPCFLYQEEVSFHIFQKCNFRVIVTYVNEYVKVFCGVLYNDSQSIWH